MYELDRSSKLLYACEQDRWHAASREPQMHAFRVLVLHAMEESSHFHDMMMVMP